MLTAEYNESKKISQIIKNIIKEDMLQYVLVYHDVGFSNGVMMIYKIEYTVYKKGRHTAIWAQDHKTTIGHHYQSSSI